MDAEHSRRWHKTEEKLEQAALDLMQTEKLERITVRAVCEAAGVNRTTFYDHFLDVYDLFDRMAFRMQKGMLGCCDWRETKAFSRDFFLPLLKFVRENHSFYEIIFRPGSSPLPKPEDDPLLDHVRPLCQKAGMDREEEIRYCLMWFMGGFSSCVQHWVAEGCRESDEDMAELIYHFLPPALSGTACQEEELHS